MRWLRFPRKPPILLAIVGNVVIPGTANAHSAITPTVIALKVQLAVVRKVGWVVAARPQAKRHQPVHRSERQAHQPTELDDDEPRARVVVVPLEHPADQIRACHEKNRGERHGLVENIEWEVRPLDASEDVIADDGVRRRAAEERVARHAVRGRARGAVYESRQSRVAFVV